MKRILHILLALTFALSTPLMSVEAAEHWSDGDHHNTASFQPMDAGVSGIAVFGIITQQDKSLPTEQQVLKECTKAMHCSSPSSHFLTANYQQQISFYQHSLWSLLREQRLLDQSPAVDLPPPRRL
ncbi:hypothetical protein [Kiloniella sp.]|uniref:hypothetical protein n=1 Tax=Kiloniella sp. TaxID=1938587 RepID=UPI003A9006A0